LSPDELHQLFAGHAISDFEEAEFGLDLELEPQLARSFPVEGGPGKIRRAYADSVADDTLGIRTRVVNGSIWSTWPVRGMAATKRSCPVPDAPVDARCTIPLRPAASSVDIAR